MSRCSDPTYEPGPIAPVDLGGFDGTLEPPAFTPIAQSFASHTGSWLDTLDGAFTALEAEQFVDVGSDVLGALGSSGGGSSASINAEALSHLELAEDGYRQARDRIVELKSWLPPDIVTSQFTTIARFLVLDAGGAPIAGATVTLDIDTGAGHVLTTGADGRTAYFSVPTQGIVGYDVTAAGHAPTSGSFNANTEHELTVTLG